MTQQVKRKLVSCPVCEFVKVEKAIMAPRIVEQEGPRARAEPVEQAAAPDAARAERRPPNRRR